MTLILIVAGLILMVGGGEILVRGAVALARRLNLSDLFIGAVLVGFGTSLPELVASLKAATSGSPNLALGNVVGSNIANMFLIVGATALIAPIITRPRALMRDGAFLLAATAALSLLIWFNGFALWFNGFLLLAGLAVFTILSLMADGRGEATPAGDMYRAEAETVAVAMPLWQTALFIIFGFTGLIFGAGWLVEGAVAFARSVAVSETVIGLTIVAIGTSLPELTTCVIAALRSKPDVAIGNVIGSNIFNALGIMGVVTLVAPFNIAYDELSLGRDVGAMILSVIMLLLFALTGRKLARWEGGVLLLAYAVYMFVLLR